MTEPCPACKAPPLEHCECSWEDWEKAKMSPTEFVRGINASIDVVKGRQRYYELYRESGAMTTHPATFAVIEEILVFLEALRERSKNGESDGGG